MVNFIFIVDRMADEKKALAMAEHHIDLMCHPYSCWERGYTLEFDEGEQKSSGLKPVYRADSEEGMALIEKWWSEFEEIKTAELKTYDDFRIFYATRAVLTREDLDKFMKTDAFVVPVVLK